jgi:hypothetical protein
MRQNVGIGAAAEKPPGPQSPGKGGQA